MKFPDPIREKKKEISYINNAFSEYVGSNIFKIIGFITQNIILGTYVYNKKEKIVCACEDFTNENYVLYEFENLALSANPDKKIGTDLGDIMEVINGLENISSITLNDNISDKFWEMFIIDALIGNTDRHNGNWGLVVNTKDNSAEFAPMFSPKQQHKTYKDNLTFFRMKSIKNKNDLGIIRFSDMLPVLQECVELLDAKDKPYAYRRLLSEQYNYINMPDNKQKIIEKADKIYTIVTSNSKGKTAKFYKELSCNFKLLEEQSLKYNI